MENFQALSFLKSHEHTTVLHLKCFYLCTKCYNLSTLCSNVLLHTYIHTPPLPNTHTHTNTTQNPTFFLSALQKGNTVLAGQQLEIRCYN